MVRMYDNECNVELVMHVGACVTGFTLSMSALLMLRSSIPRNVLVRTHGSITVAVHKMA